VTGTLVWDVVAVGLAALAGLCVPFVMMRMLWPSIERSATRVRNYRGIEVGLGLGTVWLVWAVAAAGIVALTQLLILSLASPEFSQVAESLGSGRWFVASFLVLAAFAFGLVDDVFGDGDSRGFRGHLSALRRGRLTTGGLKLLGIGVASAAAASLGAVMAAQTGWGPTAPMALHWVVATLAIALTANLVNLTDLRPGRALKVYSALAICGVASIAWTAGLTAGAAGGAVGEAVFVVVPVTALLALGPVLAVWRLDLGERGMLGDAGANAMGALAGFMLASSLPLWALCGYAVIVLALNLASERVSFSNVIEANAALRWIDGLGRLKGPVAEGREHTDEGASPTDAEVDGRDSSTGKDGAI
jgi:hypothetical protein